MANQVELIEGYDELAGADVMLRYPSDVFSTPTDGLIEGRCLRIPNGYYIDFPVPADPTYTVGFHLRFLGAGGNPTGSGNGIFFREGSTSHGIVTFNANNTITISRGDGTVLATSSPFAPFLVGVWRFLEVSYKVHDSTGSIEVRLDGAVILGPTGSLDTRNGAAVGTVDNVYFSGMASFSWDLDNHYFASGSAGFQDECRVVTDLPVSDGTNTAWAASAGSDYQCVDDATQNGDTDYISSSSAGAIDTFTMATLGVTGTIRAIAVSIFGRKDDTGARSVKTHIRRASTEYDNGVTHALSVSTAGYQGIWPTDPSTGVAWVAGNIDGAEYGVKVA